MNYKIFRSITAAAAGFAVILTITNGILARKNHKTQMEVNERQQYLNDSATLGRIYEGLLRAMGEAALKGDDRLRTVLSDSGIVLSFTPDPAQPNSIGGNNHGKK